MIEEFVKAWDANKENLNEYIASHPQKNYNSYKKIVTLLFEKVINPYLLAHNMESFNIDKLHEIDDGYYQGTLLYLIPLDTYQPSSLNYVMTFVYYGSCSGCDTLMGISHYDDGLPEKEQVKSYMALCLHTLQKCKYPFSDN